MSGVVFDFTFSLAACSVIFASLMVLSQNSAMSSMMVIEKASRRLCHFSMNSSLLLSIVSVNLIQNPIGITFSQMHSNKKSLCD